MQHRELTKAIIGCAMKVHSTLGPGFLESVYQNALTHELRKANLDVKAEHAISVQYDGVVVGSFSADMIVEDCVLLEIKGIRALTTAHEVQLVNYLTATGVDVGLLINFGGASLEFKRKTRLYKPKESMAEDSRNELRPPRPATNLYHGPAWCARTRQSGYFAASSDLRTLSRP